MAAFPGVMPQPRTPDSMEAPPLRWGVVGPGWIAERFIGHPAGVNGQVSAILLDALGNQTIVNTTVFSNTPTTAVIAGTAATLTIPGPYYQPGPMTLTSNAGEILTYAEPQIGHQGLHFEAAEVARCIAAGSSGSPLRPSADSVATLRVVDEIRRQLGIVFNEES